MYKRTCHVCELEAPQGATEIPTVNLIEYRIVEGTPFPWFMTLTGGEYVMGIMHRSCIIMHGMSGSYFVAGSRIKSKREI
jgi:hypothetical protein